MNVCGWVPSPHAEAIPKLLYCWVRSVIYVGGLPVHATKTIPKLLYHWVNPVMSDGNCSGDTQV